MNSMDTLFERWKNALYERGVKDIFVQDGIVDETKYSNIIWLLRETNGYSGHLAKLIKKCILDSASCKNYWKTPSTHYKMALAVAALRHPDRPIDDIKKMKKSALLHAAVVNIKKTEGTEKSNIDEIVSFLKQDQMFIKEEVKLLKPKVIIVGGMKSIKRIYRIIFELFELEKIEDDIFFSKSLNAYVISTHHPAYTGIKYNEWIRKFQYIGKHCFYK